MVELTDGIAPMTDNLALAVKALHDGKPILLLDDNDRENEGDMIFAAEKITPATMNFLIKHGSGVVCLAMPKARLDQLGLPLMISDNTNFFNTAFTVSIEAKTGVTTGVSAKDRAHTIKTAMADNALSTDLARPGHVFPLAAQKNGVFDRAGHTEGSVDLMAIAGLKPGAVLCELMNEDGSMTIGDDRILFAKRFDMPVVTVEEIFFHRMCREKICEKISTNIDSAFGQLAEHRFKFFKDDTVTAFTHRVTNGSMPARIMIVPGENIADRFITSVVNPASTTEPLRQALGLLHDHKTDIVLMATTSFQRDASKNKHFGLIGRALLDLGVKAINGCDLADDLRRILSKHFTIEIH